MRGQLPRLGPLCFKAANDPSPRAAGCVAPYAGADPFCLALNRRWARRSLPSALRSLRGAVCSSGTPSKAVTSIETPRSMPSVMLLASNSAGRAHLNCPESSTRSPSRHLRAASGRIRQFTAAHFAHFGHLYHPISECGCLTDAINAGLANEFLLLAWENPTFDQPCGV